MEENMTPELLAQARTMESSAALADFAKEHGLELTAEQADGLFARLHSAGELSDDELENVTGGGCGLAWLHSPKFHTGDHVLDRNDSTCGTRKSDYRGAQLIMVTCDSPYMVVKQVKLNNIGTDRLYTLQCPKCGASTVLSEGQLKRVP